VTILVGEGNDYTSSCKSNYHTTTTTTDPITFVNFSESVIVLCSFHKYSKVIVFVWHKAYLTYVVKEGNAK
jgi:hypothetical protein